MKRAKGRGKKINSFGSMVLLIGLLNLSSLFLVPPAYGAGQRLPVYGYKVIRVFPHDPEAFTQGLAFHRGFLYEGTGLLGKSSLRKVELESGKILQEQRLSAEMFGEGITIWQERIIQLTWRSGIGFVYDLTSFHLLDQFTYPTEGWGLTQDGRNLIMSDGTSFLYFLNPRTFREVRRIQVRDRGIPIQHLNELEYIKGEIFANVYPSSRVVRISPKSGQVKGWIDFSGLGKMETGRPSDQVLNGIAYDPEKDRIWVTGKNWPRLFEVKPVLKRP
ncbi:MAG: glutaminyl-peptide cyclotransferase [Thermodesulfobacteriota bacterium]